jgi:hypothetical protein
VPVQIPQNAELDVLGHGWSCKRGYQNNRGNCVPVQIPQNAELDVLGHGWSCKRGYQNNRGNCVPVQIPQNAELNVLGNGWTCKRGYQDNRSHCVPVQIPQYAELDVLGHGWTCKRGFQNNGGDCVAVRIPTNGKLNALGNGWDCNQGFKKANDGCQEMTPTELAAYNRMVQEFLKRRARLLGSGNTYTSDKGAEFVIRVTDADLNCREGLSNAYDSCEVEIRYAINTNYNGKDDPNVSIHCEAELSYTDKTGLTGTKSEDESNSIYMYGNDYSGGMDLDFSFYEEAVRVRLTEVRCQISSIY